MAAKNLHYLELTETARRIRVGEVSPVDLTKSMLARISKYQKRLAAYATVTEDLALRQAKKSKDEIARGRYRGPLHGIPIAVKDLCYTKGVATAAGMVIHSNFKPKYDATVVRRLAAAGAVLLGKLQMTEGAFGEHHPEIKAPVNPWNKLYWPGVSSSGSGVATAAGLCFASLGSDTGGSIRFPSAANGLTGLKPTWGRVSRHGIFELAASLDHIGPMCRSAADCAAVLQVIAGADAKDPTAAQEPVPNYLAGIDRPLRGLRLGLDRAYNSGGVDAETKAVIRAAEKVFRDLGAEIRPVNFPDPAPVVRDWMAHCAVETAAAHAATYSKHKDRYGPALAGVIEVGRNLSAVEFQGICEARRHFNGQVAAVFQDIDLLLVPVQPWASVTLAERTANLRYPKTRVQGLRFTAPFDYTGSPALTLPGGFSETGMPIAFQLIGRHFEEDVLLRAGHGFQKATDWHKAHPRL